MKLDRHLLRWFIFLCCAGLGMGGGTLARSQRFAFETFDQRNGLKNIDAMMVVQDRGGLLWIATQAGIYRYDGFRFEPVTIQNSGDSVMITGLVEDGLGRIWFSTSDSLGLVNGLQGRELQAPIGGFSFDLANRLSADPDDPDRIYFVSRHTLFQAEAERNKPATITTAFPEAMVRAHPELNRISGMLATSANHFWVGCGDSICAVRGAVVNTYTANDGVPKEPWLEFLVDSHGTLWARNEHHILRLDLQKDRFINAGAGLPDSSLGVRQPQIREDRQGRILTNLSDGMARFENGAWTTFHEGADLPPYDVRAILVDKQGSIWLALDGHGIAHWLGYNQFENYTGTNGLTASTTVWNFLRDRQGDLWIATEAGLRRIRRGTNRIEPLSGGSGAALQRSQTLAATPDGHIWSGSDNGMVVDFNPGNGSVRGVGQFGGVFDLLATVDGKMWVCSMNGLFQVDSHHAATQPKPLIDGHVYEGIHDPRGDDWFIAASGLYRHSGNVWTRIQLPSDYKIAFSAQIALAPDGTFWLSGYSPSLVHIKVEGDAARILERFDSPPLSSRSVLLVALDHRGWVWAGTDDGVDVYNGSRWRHLDTDDGLVWNDIDSSAFHEDVDGSIWIGTSGGISHILHPESIFALSPPTLHLGHVSIGNVTLTPGESIKVPWSHHPLTANLSTLDFDRSSRITFRYRVEGLNEDWQDSPKHDLRYPPLAPGRYRLAVVAVDAPDGLVSPASYVDFVISPPWWRSSLMRIAEGIFAFLFVLISWRWSVRRQIARQHHLEELVRRRTRELEIEKAELLRARAALQVQASHDPLTGLLNHAAVLRSLNLAMERCAREDSPLGIILSDLDHFKQVNDTYGHLTGDEVLKEYANRIKSVIRPYDEVGRYGGEEILIVLPGFDHSNAPQRLAELHHAICGTPFDCKSQLIPLTCSFGFTWFRPGLDTIESIIERADSAMYAAKRNGRNRIEIWEDLPLDQTAFTHK